MAKITIKEVDNSSAAVATGTENIVYVPGYATRGVTNTPTLVTSVAEFTKLFGTAPYVYKNDQYFDGTTASALVAKKGDYDKSYLYALELLKQGMPVLFERISDGTGSKASTKINFVTKVRQATLDTEAGASYVAISTQVKDGWSLSKVNGDQLVAVSDATFSEDVEASTVTVNSTSEGITDAVLIIGTRNSTESEANSVTIEAKYSGEYGKEITVSIKELTDEDQYPAEKERLFELLVNDIRYVVNFDIESDYYIETKLADDVNVNVSVNADEAYIKSNLYGIINKDNENLDYTETTSDEMTFASVRRILMSGENEAIPSPYYALKDKTIYDVKFITSSVYASMDSEDSTIASLMMDCAATRGDALAIIDMAQGVDKDSYLSIVDSAFPTTYVNGEDRNKYATMIAPSVKVTLSSTKTKEWMPASYAYLYALASSVKDNPIWYAISGVVRGVISNFNDVEFVVDERISKEWQSETSISINPIQNVRPYGYCIFGNRTLYRNLEGLKDSSFTNIRVLVNEAKKITLKAINRLMFESNDNVLWNNFKALVEPTLQQMKTNRGITDYKITRLQTSKKATVEGIIKIMPVEAVENFDITFSLEDSTVTVG